MSLTAPSPEAIKAAAEQIVQRLEDATPGSLFYCEADREEAVVIAEEEITQLLAPANLSAGV